MTDRAYWTRVEQHRRTVDPAAPRVLIRRPLTGIAEPYQASLDGVFWVEIPPERAWAILALDGLLPNS